ncbi:MAG: glycosyltransferase family 2 protein [Betaproteobacteria bacterium]
MNSPDNQPDQADDNEELLVSIVVYNYDSNALEALLDSIFSQRVIKNFEVIICDDATADRSWAIANEYMAKHPEHITLTRNQVPLGAGPNVGKGMQMAKGKYFVDLTRDRKFNPEYILKTIAELESDCLIVHSFVGRNKEFRPHLGMVKPSPELKRSENPLVSICIYNYNYGRFLKQCLESVAEQTYGNIEICFSDNASTDDSWAIALEFAKKYPKRMSLTRNRMNFGPSANLINCFMNYQGKYMLTLCSDDAMKPQLVERCVSLLEKYPDAAFAMVHREIVDDENNPTEEPPFYDQTCLIPGEEQAAVYMMAAINPCVSQILYNREKIQVKDTSGGINVRWFGARLLDFRLCSEYPMVYIKDPLLINRVHPLSDGALIDDNLMQCIGQFVLLHQFSEIAEANGLTKASGRMGEAIEKVGKLCLRYCARFLLQNQETTALRYLNLAQAIFPGIISDPTCSELQGYWHRSMANGKSQEEILKSLASQTELTLRNVSYPAPPGSIAC